MPNLWYELRHAARALRHRPGLTLVAVLTLALGIGGATAIFSVADAVILRPLPYADPDRLVIVWIDDRGRNQPFVEISHPTFREWRDTSHSFDALAGMPAVNQEWALTGRGDPVSLTGREVTGEFFSVFGVPPMLGRALAPEDDRPGASRVAVLGHALWRDRFGADAGVVGRPAILGKEPVTIIGVMPPGFAYPKGAQLWTNLSPQAAAIRENNGIQWMVALGRLAPGVEVDAARAELTEIWRRRHRPHFRTDGFFTVLTPLAESVFGTSRPALLALLGAVGLVLLIACANVAALLLVRSIERRFEMAVRHALGASRRRLARALFAESLLLAAMGGAGGLVAAFVGTPLVAALAPPDVPRLLEASVDMRAFAFALLASGVAAVVSSLAPILMLRRTSLEATLREGTRRMAAGRSRLRAALVVSEVAVAVVLLVGAGLLARSFVNLKQVPLGFDADPVLTVAASTGGKMPQLRASFQALLERVRAMPGVESAAAVTLRPLWSTVGYDWPFEVEGQSKEEAERNPILNLVAVTTDYFRTMGIPVRRGRVFTDADVEGQPGVVVVSESMARRTWPGQDVIGKRLKIPLCADVKDCDTPYHEAWLTVVGVVGDARYRELQAARLDLYLSALQGNIRLHHLMVRARGNPVTLAGAIRETVRALDAEQVVDTPATMASIVSEALGGSRFAARLFGAFALVALLLAALGLYGLLAYSVTRRTREIGVRMALGAQASDVRRLVFGEGMALTVGGLIAGLAVAAAAARVMGTLLYGVTPRDPLTFVAAPAVLAAAAVAACLIPVRRATRVDPAVALRTE